MTAIFTRKTSTGTDTISFRYFDEANTRVVNSLGHDFVVDTAEAVARIAGLVEAGWEQVA